MPHPDQIHPIAGTAPPRLGVAFGAAAGLPIAFLVLLIGLLAMDPGLSRGPMALVAGAGLAASAGVGVAAARRVQRRVEALQRQRDDLVEELARVSRAAALGEIASGIAHDLTNPLAVINEEVGWLGDLLSTATVAPEPTRQEFANSLAQIARQIKRAADFTRRVLDWARDLDGAGTTVGVNGVLIATLYLLEGELAAGNVRVTNALDPELPPVAGNEQDLGQVFLHLMKNALDAMKGGGGTLGISTGHANGMVWVAIADTGTGIPPDLVGRIFEPFFTTKPEGSGTGLGLRISSWIVQRAGGRIEVESAPGKGATFRVVLPAAAPPEQRPGSGESHADHSAAARR